MSKTDKILTSEYLDWHAKLSGLPSVLTDKIRSSLYKKYKKETGHEPWQLSEVYASEVINQSQKTKYPIYLFLSNVKKKGPPLSKPDPIQN
jgi:hypothetical protein